MIKGEKLNLMLVDEAISEFELKENDNYKTNNLNSLDRKLTQNENICIFLYFYLL